MGWVVCEVSNLISLWPRLVVHLPWISADVYLCSLLIVSCVSSCLQEDLPSKFCCVPRYVRQSTKPIGCRVPSLLQVSYRRYDFFLNILAKFQPKLMCTSVHRMSNNAVFKINRSSSVDTGPEDQQQIMKLGEEKNSVCILCPGRMMMENLSWSISWASPINCQAIVVFISANHPWVLFFSVTQASVQTGHHAMWSHVLPALPWSSFGSSQILSGLPNRAGPEVVAYPGRVLASSCFLILDQ